MKKSLLKSLLLMLLFCLVPALCSAEIVILKGKTRGSGFDRLVVGNAGLTGMAYKGSANLYMVLDVTSALADYTSTVNEAGVIVYNNSFGVAMPMFNSRVVIDVDGRQVGLFTPDADNNNDVNNNFKLYVSGRGSLIDVGTSVIPFAKSFKGTGVTVEAGDVSTETVTLRYSNDSKFANLDLGGDIGLTVDALVQALMDRGVVFP